MEKLIEKGEGWLDRHPEKAPSRCAISSIGRRWPGKPSIACYPSPCPRRRRPRKKSRRQRSKKPASPLRLNDARLQSVAQVLIDAGATSVIDLGCGKAKLLRLLLRDKRFVRLAGADVSPRVLEVAAHRLRLADMTEKQRARIPAVPSRADLSRSSLRWLRCGGADRGHRTPRRRAPAGPGARGVHPRPAAHRGRDDANAEYNAKWSNLPRASCATAITASSGRGPSSRRGPSVASQHGYALRMLPIGEVDEALGPPTQMAIFSLDQPGDPPSPPSKSQGAGGVADAANSDDAAVSEGERRVSPGSPFLSCPWWCWSARRDPASRPLRARTSDRPDRLVRCLPRDGGGQRKRSGATPGV